MTSQTSRYGIKYPTGGDLVSDIPAHLQQAAQSIESALADVDDRHTTAAYSPVVRTTYYQLNQVRPQPGQLGIVTREPKEQYNHYYIGDAGGTWVILYTNTKAPVLSKTVQLPATSVLWKMPFSTEQIRIMRMGQMVFVNGRVKFNQDQQLNHLSVNEKIPEGYRPAVGTATIACTGNTCVSFSVNTDGTTIALGNPKNTWAFASGAWITTDAWPTA